MKDLCNTTSPETDDNDEQDDEENSDDSQDHDTLSYEGSNSTCKVKSSTQKSKKPKPTSSKVKCTSLDHITPHLPTQA